MKLLILTFFLLVHCNLFSQISSSNAIGIGTGFGKSLFGKIKDNKKKKTIESSLQEIEINGSIISVLRVADDKIISNAKSYIIRVQNHLKDFYKLYETNQHIDIPYYVDDLIALKSVDNDWPTDYYEKEIGEYRNYEKRIIARENFIQDSLETVGQIERRRIDDSLLAVKKRYSDSVVYTDRVRGFHFENKEYTLLKERPTDKSSTVGKIYLGSYVRTKRYSDTSKYLKVSLENVEGYLKQSDLTDDLDKINSPDADLGTYKSKYYYKYEPNYDYTPERDEVVYVTKEEYYTPSKKYKSSIKKKQSYSQGRRYITGPRGGCFYLTSSGTKVYVDHSYCR